MFFADNNCKYLTFQMMKHGPHQPPQHGSTFPSGLIRPAPIPANEHQEMLFRPRPGMPVPNMNPSVRPPIVPHQPDLLELIHCAPMNYEVLQRPEAHNLQRALESGDANVQTLLVQFSHGNLGPVQREILLNVLKIQQAQGNLATKYPGPHHVAPPPPPQHLMPNLHIPSQQHGAGFISPSTSPLMDQQLQQPHHPQQHPGNMQRLSPLVPFFENKPGNLSVSPTPGHQRIPSPQELVLHTQQIMQNALIKRKLEEQKENYRRRQGEATGKDDHKSDSPLPINFTPTAVMKKLAAERRDSDPKPQIPELRISQLESNGREQLDPRLQQPKPSSPGSNVMPMMPPVPLPPPNPILMMQQQQQMAAIRMQQQPDPRLMSGQTQGLSRFFSPEVLAQAQSGNAPSMPPVPIQKAMTLEEIERQTAAAAVRN